MHCNRFHQAPNKRTQPLTTEPYQKHCAPPLDHVHCSYEVTKVYIETALFTTNAIIKNSIKRSCTEQTLD